MKLVGRKSNFAAFTMIEIAISLAVIAFALVAIIGVLPTGINVQKDNREDTIINQEGPYWLEAIRNGSTGLDHLTNYVEKIGVVLRDLNTNNTTLSTNYDEYNDILSANEQSGSNIIGMLSIPKWSQYAYPSSGSKRYVVRVEAQTRALTGSAVEQGNPKPDLGFDYVLQSEIVPFSAVQVPFSSTNYTFQGGGEPTNATALAQETEKRKAEWVKVKTRELNTSEIRLSFRWPVLGGGKTGPGFQSFRAVAAGNREKVGSFYFFQPRNFTVAEGP